MADTYRPYVAELADKRGYIHPIHAKQLAEERTVTMTGDVTGTANWDFGEPASSSQASESMALSIGEKKVTTAKLDDGAVTTPKVADDAVTLAKIDDNAMNGTVQDNDSKLATHAAVKTYVDAQISGQGTYLGKKTVAEVNAMNVNNLHNGDRVQMADAGTINLGPGGVGFDVVAGEDLILYKSGSTVQWDTMDGNFKTKQTPVADPAADGTTITAIAMISQNANGEITATKKTIRTGNGSNTGVVKLSDSTSSTSGVSGGVAATPAAVKAAYDLASGKKDKQTAIDTDTSSGSGKGGTTRTLTRLQQDANGVITPMFADIPTATAQTKGLMGTAEYTKLQGIAEGATKTEASSTNGNIKIDGTETTVYSHPTQTAYTGKPAADAAPAFGGTFTVSQVTTNGTGHVTGLTDRTITIPSATATTSSNGLMSSSDKSKLDGIAEGAEVNQNAFGKLKVGSVTIAADSKTDTLEIAGGTGIDAVGDTTNDKVTLSLDSATQASLGKADSAVQDVTVDGASVVNSSTKVATVPNASTSAKGAVQLAGSIGATVSSENNKAASEKAVRDAINALDAEVTSNDGTNVQVKVTEADGKISAVNVTTDNTENRNNKVSSWQTTPDNTHYPSEKLVKDELDAKAPLASPALTGTPTAPTAASGTDTTQIATTAFVQRGLNGKMSATTVSMYGVKFYMPFGFISYDDNYVVFETARECLYEKVTVGIRLFAGNASAPIGSNSKFHRTNSRLSADSGRALTSIYYKTTETGVEIYVLNSVKLYGPTRIYVPDARVTTSILTSSVDTSTMTELNWTDNLHEIVGATNGSAIGSTSVPVYVNSSGEVKSCTDDFVHDAEIAKMVQVETVGTAAGSSLQPVYVDASGVAKAGMYSSWESARGTYNWINALSVGWYRSSGNVPTTQGTTPQYIRFFGLEQQGIVDFWVNQFGPNSPMAMHFTVDFTSSGPGTIVIKERTGYNTDNIESLVVYREKSGTSVRGLIIKIVNSQGYNFGWRSTGNITSSNCEKLTDTEYTTFIASYHIMTSVTPPTRGGFSSSERNKQRNHDILDTGDVSSSYSATGTAPVNGTAVAAALATSLTDVEYVAAQSGGGGNLNKTKNGSTSSVLAFMTTAEATSLWQSAWAAAN